MKVETEVGMGPEREGPFRTCREVRVHGGENGVPSNDSTEGRIMIKLAPWEFHSGIFAEDEFVSRLRGGSRG